MVSAVERTMCQQLNTLSGETKMKLNDLVRMASKEEFQKNLARISHRLRFVGQHLGTRHDLGSGCKVFQAFGESTAAQLDILKELFDGPIEITAGVCRTIFEIYVTLLYCLSTATRLSDYASQAATDEISLYKSVKKLTNESTDEKHLQLIDGRINDIRDWISRNGLNLKPERASISSMAREVGLGAEYDTLYGIFSKYIHASAWLVLRPRSHTDLPSFRVPMQLHSQLYAGCILKKLEELQSTPNQAL